MKFTTFILVTYFSFLTVQPVVQQIYSLLIHQTVNCQQDCCAKKNPENSNQNPKNCCHKEICNPVCPCCLVCTLYPTFEIKRFFVQVKCISALHSNFISGFLSDCFHPPKIV